MLDVLEQSSSLIMFQVIILQWLIFVQSCFCILSGDKDFMTVNYERGDTSNTYGNSQNRTINCSKKLAENLEKIRKKASMHYDRTQNEFPFRTNKLSDNVEVKEMRIRVPAKAAANWIQVSDCIFDPKTSNLNASIVFNDVLISGAVGYTRSLLNTSTDRDKCSLMLRLHKAGIRFQSEPITNQKFKPKFNIKTSSQFIEPGFVTVYAYGCDKMEPIRRFRQLDDDQNVSDQMEHFFTKAIRSLLTKYLQKELQPILKETMVKNLGYVVSYG